MNKKQAEKDISLQGQSVIEYLLLVGVIIALLAILLRPGGYFSRNYEYMLQKQGEDTLNAVETLFFIAPGE